MVLHPHLAKLAVEAHIEDLHRAAGAVRSSRPERAKPDSRWWRVVVFRGSRLRARPQRESAPAHICEPSS
ncbi:MAG TPA: hypothetical protein VG057_13105 [Solirubrobacteraceae bacterium]|jgi:hypothetical protein|nr:hypothetical protein [Solirubrobacteraceae bacterium]